MINDILILEIEEHVRSEWNLRREWQQSRSPATKMWLSNASRVLKRALVKEEDLQNVTYIRNLSNNKSTNYSL